MSEPYRLIDTTDALGEAARALEGAPSFYIDTEFESGPGETSLCLIQISAGKEVYLVDPLRLTAVESLTGSITGDGAEWVLHAGGIDIGLLLDKLELVEPPAIFDTQVAWGLLGAEYSVSLAYLNYRVLGVRGDKEHQADSWTDRPISASQLAYAASDVETLPRLRARLGESLQEQGKLELAREVSREFCFTRPQGARQDRGLSMDDFRKAWELDPGGQAALRFLIDWYNDPPDGEKPSWLKPRVLFLIARRLPETASELAGIKGVPKRWAYQLGDRLMGRLLRATGEADEREFPVIEPEPYVTYEELRVDAFITAVRQATSEAISIAPDVAYPAWLTQEHLRPAILSSGDVRSGLDVLGGWRQEWLAGPYEAFCEGWSRLRKS